MPRANPALGHALLPAWQRLSRLPLGRLVFSWLVGRMAPYTGSVGGRYREVRAGYARAELRDRRRVRNHLGSVHAIALVNLAEMTSGVAVLTALPAGTRGIVTHLEITYHKKARGLLTCVSEATPPAEIPQPCTLPVLATISNSAGDVVAQATVHWRLSPMA